MGKYSNITLGQVLSRTPSILRSRLEAPTLGCELCGFYFVQDDVPACLFSAIQPVKKSPKPRNFTSSFSGFNLI